MGLWAAADFNYIGYGGTTYVFAPHELVYVGQPNLKTNQIVQESSSGVAKVQQLDPNIRSFYEFAIVKMPADNRTVGAFTVYGYDALRTLITTTINYRQQTVTLKPSGISIGGIFNAQFWGSEWPTVTLARIDRGGLEYYGDGSARLLFRKTI